MNGEGLTDEMMGESGTPIDDLEFWKGQITAAEKARKDWAEEARAVAKQYDIGKDSKRSSDPVNLVFMLMSRFIDYLFAYDPLPLVSIEEDVSTGCIERIAVWLITCILPFREVHARIILDGALGGLASRKVGGIVEAGKVTSIFLDRTDPLRLLIDPLVSSDDAAVDIEDARWMGEELILPTLELRMQGCAAEGDDDKQPLSMQRTTCKEIYVRIGKVMHQGLLDKDCEKFLIPFGPLNMPIGFPYGIGRFSRSSRNFYAHSLARQITELHKKLNSMLRRVFLNQEHRFDGCIVDSTRLPDLDFADDNKVATMLKCKGDPNQAIKEISIGAMKPADWIFVKNVIEIAHQVVGITPAETGGFPIRRETATFTRFTESSAMSKRQGRVNELDALFSGTLRDAIAMLAMIDPDPVPADVKGDDSELWDRVRETARECASRGKPMAWGSLAVGVEGGSSVAGFYMEMVNAYGKALEIAEKYAEAMRAEGYQVKMTPLIQRLYQLLQIKHVDKIIVRVVNEEEQGGNIPVGPGEGEVGEGVGEGESGLERLLSAGVGGEVRPDFGEAVQEQGGNAGVLQE